MREGQRVAEGELLVALFATTALVILGWAPRRIVSVDPGAGYVIVELGSRLGRQLRRFPFAEVTEVDVKLRDDLDLDSGRVTTFSCVVLHTLRGESVMLSDETSVLSRSIQLRDQVRRRIQPWPSL